MDEELDAIAPDEEAMIDPDEGLEIGEKAQTSRGLLEKFAAARGDISGMLDATQLATLGANAVRDYLRDDESRSEWKAKVKTALSDAAQDDPGTKSYPFQNASNVKHPMLAIASQQFAARAYPAIVRGDEAVKVKVFGTPPVSAPPGAAQAASQGDPAAVQVMEQNKAAQNRFAAKQRRADRVKQYLNYQIFYAMDSWEADTDAMLHTIPITGIGFRKVYYNLDERRPVSESVSALHLIVPANTQSLKRCPRITQEYELYPYEITQRQASGLYRDVILTPEDEDDQAPRKMLEQHRLEDLDGDGVAEPYVLTIDETTSEILRIDAVYSMEDVKFGEDGRVISIQRWVPYVDYPFLPDPKGRFYAIGFGHLLAPLTEIINTSINQLIDAGHAQIAGGGFLASGVRLQGAGQNAALKWKPGEYKTVNVPGSVLKDAIVERTFPQPSVVTMQMLDMMLAAAKDIASVKDILTGDSPSNAPVGTTLAVIEQGLQVFTSIYKRIYRSLREEFRLLYECESRYGNRDEYKEVLDDPEADMDADFNDDGKDIQPVSDPSAVTKMQSLAKAQALQPFLGQPFANSAEIFKRILSAIEVENPDALVAQPPPPPPEVVAKAKSEEAGAMKAMADAGKSQAQTEQIKLENASVAAVVGGIPGMEGPPGNPMGQPGLPEGGGQEPGPMDPSLMATG